ncbi:MFS transporter [Actinoplanes sp. TBRC 11911]|nr:MFS transporter [Actinoplanes sp. TBRC 11911]
MSTTFRSLTVRNYRLFATGQLVKLVGVWMMFTAQDWLVLSLSNNSPAALGATSALQFTPVLLLTLWGGRLADRYDKRKLLVVANTAFAITAIVFAVLVASGVVVLWHVFLFAGLLGIANSIETPVRQSFVSELVENRLLPNALALSAATFNTARIGGPALAGVALAVLHTGPVFLVATVLAVAPIFTYTSMRPAELFRSEHATKKDARILDGLRYVRKRHDLLLPLSLMAVVGMIGFNFPVTLAALAKINFHAGPSTFGLLTTSLAVGALGGALAGSARRARPGAYVVLGAAIAFGLLEFVVGFAPSFVIAMAILVPTGFFSIYLAQAANHRVQMGVAPEYRGRVMALYVLVFLGTTPIGSSLAGWWGDRYGVPSSIWLAGLVCFVAGVAAVIWQLRISGDRLSLHLRPYPKLTLTHAEAMPAAETVPQAETLAATETVPQAETLPAAETVPQAETLPATETVPQAETGTSAEGPDQRKVQVAHSG